MADQEFNLETGEPIPERENPDDPNLEQDDEHLGDEGDQNPTPEDDDHPEEDDPGVVDEEREAIRQRRRQERKDRKEAARQREDSLRRELAARDTQLAELRNRLDLIDRRNSGSELAQIEQGKKQAADAYRFFKDQIRVAGESGNHAAVADATEKMIQAQRNFDHLTRTEQALRQRQAAPQPLDPRLAQNAQDWMARNPWYNPSGQDQDSEIVMRLDQRLAQEGWDPTTREYWRELDSRVKKYLPHRSNSGKIERDKPRSVVAGSGRERASPGQGKTYKLSAERVQALKDAGLWDDPKVRADAIRRFQTYDQQNKA